MTTSNPNESFDSEFASTTLSPSKGTTYQTKNTSNTLTSLSCGKDGQDSIDSEYSRHFNIANAKSSEDFATRADEIAVDNFNTIRSNNESTRGRVLAFSTLRSITKRVARGRSLNVRSLSIGRRHNKEEDAEYLINYFNRLNQRGENDSANSPRARKEVIEMNTDCKMTLSDPRNNKSSSSAIGFNESHLLESTTPEKYSKARISHKSEPRPSTTRSTAAPNLKVTSNQGSGNYFSSNKQKASSYHLSTRLRSEGLVSGKNYAMEHDEAISKRTSYVEKSTQRHKITRSKGLVCTDPAQLAETPTPRGTAIDCSRNPLSSQVIKRSEGGFGVTKASGQNHLNDRYKNVTTRGRDAVGETNTKRVNESHGRASSGDAICVSRRNLQEMSGHAPSRGKKQRELSQSIDRNDSSRLRAQSTRSFKASKKGKNQQASYTFLKQGEQKAPGEVDPFSAGILHSKEMTSAKKESFANNTWSAHVRNIDHDGPLPHAIINYNYYIQNQTYHYRPKRDMTLYQGQEQQAIHNFPMPKQMDWPPNPPNTDERDMYFVHRNANNVEENIKSSSSSSGNTSESSPMKNARCAVCHKVLHSGEYVEYCNIYFCKKSDDGARGTCFQCAFCHRSMDELLLNQEAGDEKNAILKWTKVISNARGSVIKCGQCAMGLAFPSTLTSAPYNKLSSGGKGAFTSELIVHRIGEVNETYHRGRHGFRTHRVHYFWSQSAPHALPLPSHNDKSDDDSSDSSDDEVQSRQEELQVHKIENQRKLHSISNARPNHTTSTTRGSDIAIVASKIKNRSELEHEMHSLRSQNKRLEEANSNLELKNKQLSVAVTQLSTVASTSKRMESELIQQVASFVSQTKALTFEYHRTMEILTQKEMELSFSRQNAQLDRNNMGGRVNASYDDAHSNQIGQSTFRDEFRLSNISKCYAENTVSFTNNGVRKSVLDEKGHTIHLNESVAPPAELDPTDSIEHRNALARSA